MKSEDGQNSTHDINDDDQNDRSIEGEEIEDEEDVDEDDDHHRRRHRHRPNQSDTSDPITKTDDEHSWDPNNNNTTTSASSYQFLSQSSTPRSSISDRYYLPSVSGVTGTKNGSIEDHR